MRIKLLIFLICSSNLWCYSKSEIDSIFTELYRAMDNRAFYMTEKEHRIAEYKNMLKTPNITPQQVYEINSSLYHEYKTYITDSAVSYIKQNKEIAQKLESIDWISESNVRLSALYSVSGMYIESLQLLNSINRKHLPDWLLIGYYDAYKQLYDYYSYNNSDESKYKALRDVYRDSLLMVLEPNSNHYKIVYAEKLSDQGKLSESKKLVQDMMKQSVEDNHERAVLAYVMALFYKKENDLDGQKKYFAISAISDTKKSIKENASLKALANVLYEAGDIKNAYRFIKFSLEDAIFCNARLRTYEISEIFPIIDGAYQEKVENQKKGLQTFLILISILSFFLILAVVYVYKQMERLSKARKELFKVNNKLNNLNNDLQSTNLKLKSVNQELSEANHLKEEYIGHFLDLCSTYIDKLENYQKRLNKMAATKKIEELYKLLKSPELIDNELKELYNNFDNIFLHLYPTFVEDFNALLQPAERIDLKNGELLNAELRMYALIRLGITDNSKIASFLRYSMSTVYNYRTKVRNKAIIRDRFESMVIEIGSSQHK